MNNKYALLSFVTALAVMGMSFGSISLAAVTPLTCSVNTASVLPNHAAVFTAAGGDGFYVWSGTNLNITNATGNQFAVSYPNPGVYPITVTSAGLSATCNITVAGSVTSGALTCSPAVQNVTLGQNATFSVTGGTTGVYVWSSPDLTIANSGGTGFTASYASTGLKTMSVTSGGVSDTCAVNVLAGAYVPPTPPVTPGLPNTGGGYGK